jgi:hypothetical protein
VGLAYPAYATCRALEATGAFERPHWLCYWLAFGGISAVEALASPSFPGYSHAKLLLLLWLQSKRYQGARRLYVDLLRPLIRQMQPHVDALLQQLHALQVCCAPLGFAVWHARRTACTEHMLDFVRVAMQERPELKGMAEHLHVLVSKIPILEWFVRIPSEDSALDRWLGRLLG